MVRDERLICLSSEISDDGKGVRFIVELPNESRSAPAFMVRHQGKIYAYLNRCAHIGVELDWIEGEFFDDSGLYLICSTHGATYEPHTGFCVGGPCKGKSLQRLEIEERDGNIFLKD